MKLEKWIADNPDWLKYVDLVLRPPSQEELMKWYPGDVSTELLSRCYEMVTEGGGSVTRGALYVRIRREEKTTDKWACLLALNAFPGIQTTDTFWAGRKYFHQTHGEKYADKVRQELKKRGINLKPGDEYMPELARRPYDPEAVVPFDGARSYIKKMCEKRGWSCDGAVTVKSREPETDPHADVPIADSLVKQKAKLAIEKDPSLKKLSRKDLRATIQKRFSSGVK